MNTNTESLVRDLEILDAKTESLVRDLEILNVKIIQEMRKEYPLGSSVVFRLSEKQKEESFGHVVGHATANGPELRVRYDGSSRIVGLYFGHARFSIC